MRIERILFNYGDNDENDLFVFSGKQRELLLLAILVKNLARKIRIRLSYPNS